MTQPVSAADAEVFEQHRPRLTAIAYGMLGELADAEDAVQDAWFRWSRSDRAGIREPGAFLTTVVTRLAIDRLRSAQKRRESYVGPWLPEPIVREVGEDPADVVAEAESLSIALLTALERLNPVERAVFLLREVFDQDYADIAEVVERTPAACRQIAVRARDHVGDHTRSQPRDEERDLAVVTAFVEAAASGDLDGITRVLADDVIAWSDGGGQRNAARKPIVGAETVARFFAKLTQQGQEVGITGRIVVANGDFAVRADGDGEVFVVVSFEILDGQIVGLRSVVNPAKLTRV